MKKYSRVRIHEGKRFRYNYEDHVLEYICKPNADMLEELKDEATNCKLDWMRLDAKHNLESYETTGYIVISSEGLGLDNYREDPKHWIAVYAEELNEELYCLQQEFEMYG